MVIPHSALGSSFLPATPTDFRSLGISESLVLDLVLRRMMMEGQCTLQGLSQSLRLSSAIVEIVFRRMRQQQLVEVKGMLGNDYHFLLSQAGRQLASDRFQISQYAGAAPVSLQDYEAATKAQSKRLEIDRSTLRTVFSDLVVPDDLLDQLGPALIAQNSIFIYGPTGNGKTSLAERMLRVYRDAVLIPYALEVDNQIISVYDPVVHRPMEHQDRDLDPRWVLCKRPCIVVGGELIPSMLELRRDEGSGVYAAPLQMKANNGIFIIDDFGRQLISPRELLNRWIVPLDRRVDYLSLRYGVKFQIPFEVLVVFSTNLDPSDLADEAFLRRIKSKIYVGAVDPASFQEIFSRVLKAKKLTAAPECLEYLERLCLEDGRTELRACYPLDICNILQSIGQYERRPPKITRAELERATALYFTRA